MGRLWVSLADVDLPLETLKKAARQEVSEKNDQRKIKPQAREPRLLKATTLPETDRGTFEWDPDHTSDLLTISNDRRTVEWKSTTLEEKAERYAPFEGGYLPPLWLRATTRAQLHSGSFQWDFIIDEMAGGQIGIGFLLQWDIGPDWGFFGYLGSSTTAWAYDPLTGNVVRNTESMEGGLPQFPDGRAGIVTVHLDLPRNAEGKARFSILGVDSQPIDLPESSVVLPAACLLAETQKVTLGRLQQK